MIHPLLEFWGKASPADGDGPQYHPLAFHMLDVAACAERLLAARPPAIAAICERFRVDAEIFSALALRLIALHDIGKCAPGFQIKAPHWPTMLGERPTALASIRHDHAGLWLFGEVRELQQFVKSAMPTRKWGAHSQLLSAVCGHHGEPASPGEIRERLGDKAQRAAADLAAAILTALSPAPPFDAPREAFAPLSFALAGVTILADWLGSNRLWFPYKAPGEGDLADELAAYWREEAQPRALEALAKAGLTPVASASLKKLGELFPMRITHSTPLQALAETLDLSGPGPKLVVVEDMTGAGKTEAAVMLAHRLIVDGAARGLHVALPTMATANAMFGRLRDAYRALFAEGADPSLALAHGKRHLVEGFAAIRGEIGVNHDEQGNEDDPSQISASAFCADWIARSNKQAFLAQVGVGTIDQALLAALPARHQALRLFGLSDKVLVIDEAHAYDAYMGIEIERLLRFHATQGGSAIILSATLARKKRADLVKAFREGLGAFQPFIPESAAYPLITLASADGVQEIPCALREGLARNLRIERLASIDDAHGVAFAAAKQGAAVALIRNTVDEAIASYEHLKGLFERDVMLFHARFAMDDRLRIEKAVLQKFGRDGEKRGGVLVATQVIEQSLDLDFDFLITDLAPVDLLIQRAGRLWRHLDKRLAATRPRLEGSASGPVMHVISAPPAFDAKSNWLDATLPKTKFVYEKNVALLWRSAKALFDAGAIVSRTRGADDADARGDIRALIEAAYGEKPLAIPETLEEDEIRAMGDDGAKRSQARFNTLDCDKGYELADGRWESDTRIPTRLEDDKSVTFRLAALVDGELRPFAARDGAKGRADWEMSEVSFRAARCPKAAAPDRATLAKLDKIKARWTVSERETPVLILSSDPETPDLWRGMGETERGETLDIAYSPTKGLLLP